MPATIPVALPLSLAYNEPQTIDDLVTRWERGTLTPGKAVLTLALVGLDLLPLVGRAPVFRNARRAFAVLEGFQVAGQVVVMTLQAQQTMQDLRDQDIASMADSRERAPLCQRDGDSDPGRNYRRGRAGNRSRCWRPPSARGKRRCSQGGGALEHTLAVARVTREAEAQDLHRGARSGPSGSALLTAP